MRKMAGLLGVFIFVNLAACIAFAQVAAPNFAVAGPAGNQADLLQTSAYFTAAGEGRPAMLHVTADIAPGWHTYSITQASGGPAKSRIKISESPAYKVIGEFKPSQVPEIHEYKDIWPGLKVEEHEGSVTWSAPIEFAAGTDLSKLEIPGSLNAMICAKECLPPTDYKFVAKLNEKTAVATAGSLSPQGAKNYKSDLTHVALQGEISPSSVVPGSLVKLTITAQPEPGWHIYAREAKDPKDISKPTLILLTDSAGFRFSDPIASDPPVEKTTNLGQSGKARYHEKAVSWTIEIDVPKNAKSGEHLIRGIIGYQTCKEDACDQPRAAWFEGILTVGKLSPEGSPLFFRDGKYREASMLAEGTKLENIPSASLSQGTNNSSVIPPIKVRVLNDSDNQRSLIIVLASAFLGGLILNLMPCVLPVIGLKILSFVEQSHHSRGQVFMLNLWYTLGLMSVFMVLAVLASGASLGLRDQDLAWGEQFSSPAFNIVMSGIVFVMALSFLGIWEIPIPGFAGSGKATEFASQEGASGAFAKGVLSTVLATPCSGPFLGSVFGFMLRQPPGVIFALFGAIGLGMASPYLLIGAFPRLIRFLPKPGAWMDTFKHIMGFVLLGTVVFLFTFLKRDYLVPTFAMLMGLWAACWWIGRVPLTAELGRKLFAWIQGAVIATAVGYFAFTVLVPRDALIPWQPFTPENLAKFRSEGKTVMVDFTADWCLTCKTNLKFAINTPSVLKAVKKNNVVPLLADWTDGAPEIKEALTALESKSIPVLAIFSADRPDEAIVLRDLISANQIVEAIEAAGPSKSTVMTAETAMNKL